jgi:hypothetical protein
VSSRHSKIAAAAAACIATTLVAAAEPPARQVDMPTRDVWVTLDGPFPAQAAQNTPSHRQLPIGDFWPADDALTRAADAPAPPTRSAREDVAIGSIK